MYTLTDLYTENQNKFNNDSSSQRVTNKTTDSCSHGVTQHTDRLMSGYEINKAVARWEIEEAVKVKFTSGSKLTLQTG